MTRVRTIFRLGELVEVVRGSHMHAHKIGEMGVVVGRQNTLDGMYYGVLVGELRQNIFNKDLAPVNTKKISACNVIK